MPNRQRTVVAFVSDTQCGSTVGLMPPHEWTLSELGVYRPNELQLLIWKQWEQCWDRVAGLLDKHTRLVIVHVGDAVEGIHHHTAELVASRMDVHQAIHVSSMKWAMDRTSFDRKRGDKLYYLAGTPVHVEPGGISEEIVARELDATPLYGGTKELHYEDATYLRDHFMFTVNGVLFDAAHHGAIPGRRQWLRGNDLRLTIKSIYFECLEYKKPIPRYWIRAHKHVFTYETYMGECGKIDGFILPSFQGLTEYGQIVCTSGLSNIGMLMVVVEKTGESHWVVEHINVNNNEVEEL